MEQDKVTNERLMEVAKKARFLSYSPYSGITVGAALLAASGKVYVGANIENASFSPTVCAERVAFYRAITEGERSFVKIAIAGGRQSEASVKRFSPCGVCRQVMTEFCKEDFKILLESENGIAVYTLQTLLPESFGKEKF